MSGHARRRSPRYSYILLHLSGGINDGEPRHVLDDAMNEAAETLGVDFWVQPVRLHCKSGHAEPRIFFSLERGRRDDTEAERIAEAVLMLGQVFNGTGLELDASHLSFPLRSSKLRRSRSISLEAIVSEVESTADARAIFSSALIAGSYGLSTHMVALAIRACPVLLRNEKLRFAAAFLCVSMHDFYVSPGGLRDALDDGDRIPTRAAELASWEASYQNSYKCIEAVIGDPPRDESRYRAKLLAAGLDPEEEVGYQTKAKVADVIREMNRLRDTRVAHGSTLRGIKLHQMVEFQACATYVLEIAIERAYGGRLYAGT